MVREFGISVLRRRLTLRVVAVLIAFEESGAIGFRCPASTGRAIALSSLCHRRPEKVAIAISPTQGLSFGRCLRVSATAPGRAMLAMQSRASNTIEKSLLAIMLDLQISNAGRQLRLA